jgi:hypothetical protein
MMGIIWLGIAFALLAFLVYRAGRVWLDFHRGQGAPLHRLGWALMGAVAPDRYWWHERIQAMSPRERDNLLDSETAALGLSRADGLRCPLCDTEILGAWALTIVGRPTVAPGPVECPACDFRLDACRHCAHLLPGSPQGWGAPAWAAKDRSSGRCSRFKSFQPVEQVTSPDMARQLKARGYEQVRAPLPIVDSFMPPDFCTSFAPERRLLKEGGIRWPGARRAALLRLLAPPDAHMAPGRQETARQPAAPSPEPFPEGNEQWLL